MSKVKLSALSNEQLLKNEKTLKVVTFTLIGMIGVLLVLTIILAFIKGFSALSAVPVALFPIVIVNLNSLKEIKVEKELRKL